MHYSNCFKNEKLSFPKANLSDSGNICKISGKIASLHPFKGEIMA